MNNSLIIQNETLVNSINSLKLDLLNENTNEYDETKWISLLNRIVLDQKSKFNTIQLETVLLNEAIKHLQNKNTHLLNENLKLKNELETLNKV